jgi:hypothetical protein
MNNANNTAMPASVTLGCPKTPNSKAAKKTATQVTNNRIRRFDFARMREVTSCWAAESVR